jgi:hypothetical protein
MSGFFSEEDRILEARLLFLGNDARKKGSSITHFLTIRLFR